MVALGEALALHAAGEGRLSIVHAVDVAEGAAVSAGEAIYIPPSVDDAPMHAWLDTLVEGIPRADGVVLRGAGSARSVVAWALEADVDLIVVGGMRGRLDRALRGDFARYVVGHAHCSVLVARGE
jgi:nucleotide-binding universal stress UspA family protein